MKNNIPEHKECPRCNNKKHKTEFKIVQGKYLSSYCIQCRKIIKKEHYDSNREKYLAYAKYYRENVMSKEDKKEYMKEYRENKKEEIYEQVKKYRKTEKGSMACRNVNNKRRTVTKKGDVQTEDLVKLREKSKYCYWCNKRLNKKNMHIDHYIPISKGGQHTISNLVASCDKCNIQKSAKDPIYFAQTKGKLL